MTEQDLRQWKKAFNKRPTKTCGKEPLIKFEVIDKTYTTF